MAVTSELTADRGEIARALALLVPAGQVTELRALEALTATYRRPHTVSGFFNDREQLASAAAGIGYAAGIYVVLNPLNPDLMARASNRLRDAVKDTGAADAHVLRRRWLPVDCDPARLAGISATDAEHERALDRARAIRDLLCERGWPEPILADSGNGGHLLYPIDLPVEDGGLVQRCLESLSEILGDADVKVDTAVSNPARIWKLYGTPARKGDSTPERPHRMARILSAPATLEVVPPELLEQLASAAPVPATGQPDRRPAHRGHFDLESWMRTRCPDSVGPAPWASGSQRWVFDVCPFDPEHTNRSAFVVQYTDGRIGAGCHHNGCKAKGWGWKELREQREPGCYDRRTDGERRHRLLAEGTSHVRTTMEESTANGRDDRLPEPQIVSAVELVTGHPELRPPLIHGLLRRTEIGNLIAPPKKAKSWLALHAAVCVASGRSILDQFMVERSRVLIIDNELHANTLAARIPEVVHAMGVPMDAIEGRLDVDPLRGRVCDLYGMRSYFARIETCRYGLIILDALYRFLPADMDENSNAAMTALYNTLDDYAQMTGAAILRVHHTSKGIQAGKAITDVGAGAGALSRATDSHLILRDHEEEGVAVLDAVARSWPPIEPVCLRWRWPLWRADPDLDPANLRQTGGKKRRPESPVAPAKPKPKAEMWTLERFVSTFVSAEPRTTDAILAYAAGHPELSEWRARRLLVLAVDTGVVHKWVAASKREPHRFATIPLPATEVA